MSVFCKPFLQLFSIPLYRLPVAMPGRVSMNYDCTDYFAHVPLRATSLYSMPWRKMGHVVYSFTDLRLPILKVTAAAEEKNPQMLSQSRCSRGGVLNTILHVTL